MWSDSLQTALNTAKCTLDVLISEHNLVLNDQLFDLCVLGGHIALLPSVLAVSLELGLLYFRNKWSLHGFLLNPIHREITKPRMASYLIGGLCAHSVGRLSLNKSVDKICCFK